MQEELPPKKFCTKGHEIAKDFVIVFGNKPVCGICLRARGRKCIRKVNDQRAAKKKGPHEEG